MSDLAIRVDNLSKCYRIGQRERARTLRDVLTGALTASPRWFARDGKRIKQDAEWIWALRDVSFEVKQGEAVGIIGRNGAGKSTLLKILSRITEPSEGHAQIFGRVGSLLEVGTGFHSELTGRENIYLNGAILGMKRREIQRQFDEIVAFAEIAKFIDTPVKHYSSGMYLRLAFAVAAHLDPEILLVDEVLAVGDAEFQKKCLGKMNEATKQGRTVLYISHNLASLANLCSRAILLAEGKIMREGLTGEVIREYISTGKSDQGERVWKDRRTAPASPRVRLDSVRIVSEGKMTADVNIQKDVQIQINFSILQPSTHIHVGIHLLDRIGGEVLASANMASMNLLKDAWADEPYQTGLYRSVCVLPSDFLNEGRYSINVAIVNEASRVEVFEREVVSFTVHDTGAMRKEYGGEWIGVVRPKLAWQTQCLGKLGADSVEEQSN